MNRQALNIIFITIVLLAHIWMNRFWKTSLLVILSGLLFSPAEGVCLLPISDTVSGEVTRDYSVSGRPSRFDPTIRWEEKQPNDTDRSVQAQKYRSVIIGGMPTSCVLEQRFSGCSTNVTGSIRRSFFSTNFSSQSKPRPPPGS